MGQKRRLFHYTTGQAAKSAGSNQGRGLVGVTVCGSGHARVPPALSSMLTTMSLSRSNTVNMVRRDATAQPLRTFLRGSPREESLAGANPTHVGILEGEIAEATQCHVNIFLKHVS